MLLLMDREMSDHIRYQIRTSCYSYSYDIKQVQTLLIHLLHYYRVQNINNPGKTIHLVLILGNLLYFIWQSYWPFTWRSQSKMLFWNTNWVRLGFHPVKTAVDAAVSKLYVNLRTPSQGRTACSADETAHRIIQEKNWHAPHFENEQ